MQIDIAHHGGGEKGKGEDLEQMGGVEPGHAPGQGNGQGFEREKHKGEPQNRAAAETPGEAVIQQHHGKFQDSHKAHYHSKIQFYR